MIPTPRPARRDGFLRLIDPPRVLAGGLDFLAGALAAGASLASPGLLLQLAGTALLFGSSAAFEEFFRGSDSAARRDARSAPDGAGQAAAWQAGWLLLLPGALLAGAAGREAALVAVGLTLLLVLYAAVTRSIWGVGFLTLAAARATCFLLGQTAETDALARYWTAAAPVLLYALGWAALRASRQPGAPPTTGFIGLVHLLAALAAGLYLGAAAGAMELAFYPLDAVPFAGALLLLTLPRFVRAVMEPRRIHVMEAVQYGFVGLPLLEAALAAGYGGAARGLIVALLCFPLFGALRRWPIPLQTEPR